MFQVSYFKFQGNMPRKKKNSFDNRDALEILRDAFFNASPPRVAELKTSPVKTRMVADKYREEISPEDIFEAKKAPGKKRQESKLRKRTPYDEEQEELPTFWNEQPGPEEKKEPEPQKIEELSIPKQEPISEPGRSPKKILVPSMEEPPRHILKDTTAKKTIDAGLVDQFHQRIKDMEKQDTSLSPEDRAQLEKIRKTYEKKIEEAGANATEWESQNKSGSVLSGDEKPLQTSEEIKTYAEELAAEVGNRISSETENPVEIVRKESKKAMANNLMHWENEESAILQEKTILPPIEAPSAPLPPVEKLEPEPIPPQETTIDIESYAKRWAEVVQDRLTMESKESEINLMAKRLLENPKINDKDKKSVEEIKKRALEIVQSQTQTESRNTKPETTSPELEEIAKTQAAAPAKPEAELPQVLTQQEVDSILANTPEKETVLPIPPPETKPEAAPSPFDARLVELDKKISETGGTQEERIEHWALGKAQEYGYDPEKVSARLEELKKQPAGMVAMETQVLTEALKILKPETATKQKEQAPETAPDKDALKRKLRLGEYAPKTSEATSPPPKPETAPSSPEAVKEISVIVAEAFANRLGITKESLQNEPMFMGLSEGQQLLILQDLEQIALGKVQSETEKILTQKSVAEAPVDGAWYRRWSAKLYQCTTEAIKGIGKKYRLEATLAADTAKGGMAQYGEILRLLSAETNPHVEVIRKEDGSLDVHYVSRAAMAELLDNLPAKERERGFQYIESLNNTASEFRVMPLAWSSDTASRVQRRAFEKSQKRFQAAEGHLLSFISKQTESPIEHAKYELVLAQAEHAIQQEQFWNAHPEARTQLQTMTDKSWFTRFLKDGFKERALFMATGGIGRAATIGVAGFASLPITAAAIGGAMLGRAVFRGHMATARGRETLLHRARLLQETKKEGAGMRDYVTSQSLNTGFEKIIKKINAFDARDNTQPLTGEERKEKEHALKQLERILYTAQIRHTEGVITYGSPTTLLSEHFRLGRNVSAAQSRLVVASLEGFRPQSKWAEVDDKKVNDTINSVWALRKGRMSNERKAYLRKQALVQGGINAASGAFGVWIADTFALGPKFQRGIEKLIKKTGSLSGINIPHLLKTTVKKLPGFDKETLGKLGLEDTPTLKPPKNLPVVPSASTGKGTIPSIDDFVAPSGTGNAAMGMESGGIRVPSAETIVPIETVPTVEHISHIIDKRGPEGAIIDEFRNNPELAKQFGWDGRKNINTWAGSKADELYKTFRKKSLDNPIIKEEMQKLGYKPTPRGHEAMMHRIKSGAVELDPATKSISLKDSNIIKASETATLLSEAENVARKMSGLSLDKYADIRETTIADFLKKHPRGKGFEVLVEVLRQAKPSKTDLQQSISEFLTTRFGS